LSKAKGWFKRLAGGCSFTAGTLVLTKEGLKPIEEVQEGDIVLARDESTGENVWRTVIGTFSKMHDSVLVLDIQTEAGPDSQIITTEEHPFYVQGRGWIEAGRLEQGMSLVAAERLVRLAGMTRVAEQQLAYDLTVDGAHTFFVSEQQVLVHNCPVGNMGNFFKSGLGATLKSVSQKTSRQFDGQSIYKVNKKTDNPYLRKGDQYYLDGKHKDHLEVFDKNGNARAVLNLDGSLNEVKTARALAEGRKLVD
jgi:hypothetical protein